jgi:hypothetical protein
MTRFHSTAHARQRVQTPQPLWTVRTFRSAQPARQTRAVSDGARGDGSATVGWRARLLTMAACLLAHLLTMAACLFALSTASAQDHVPCADGVDPLGACAPDQRLTLDAPPPARRFASYSDVVSLARGSVSIGLVLAPFPRGPLTRLRVDVEAVTRLRSPRGLTVLGRLGVNLVGLGLDALFVAAAASYAPAAQARSRAWVGAELGYARHFQGLFLAAAAGAQVALSRGHRARPTARLVIGHAFY